MHDIAKNFISGPRPATAIAKKDANRPSFPFFFYLWIFAPAGNLIENLPEVGLVYLHERETRKSPAE